MHCNCRTLLSGFVATPIPRSNAVPPSFLIPSFALQTSFSTSTIRAARKDGNPARGTSALYRSGLKRQKLSVKLENLPKPVLNPELRSKVEVDEDHGLWGFFNEDRTAMPAPEELAAHGRGWTVAELRNKDWNDLHRLWWVCIKEINRMRTATKEREQFGNMYGGHETGVRMNEIRKTQKAIRHVLTERWYAWDNARHAAMSDPEINMYADLDKGEAAYLPSPDSEGELSALEPTSGRTESRNPARPEIAN